MPKVSIRTLDSVTHNDTTATTLINENFSALQSAIENTVSRDGTVPNFMDADLDLNSYRIINAGDPENDSDVITKGWFDQFVEDASTATADANAAAARAASFAQASQISSQNAVAASDAALADAGLAKDWATKTDGTVDGVDYSSKYYAQQIISIAADIPTVAGIASDVTTVAGIASDVADVADIKTDVTTVSGIASDVTAVKNNATDISAVAANEININTVADNETSINTVADNVTNINTVAGIYTDVTATAGIASDVTAVANNVTDISAVAADLTNINAVAADLTNIDNASSYAAAAKQWAIGDPAEPTGNSAKYWADYAEDVAQSIGNPANVDLSNLSQTGEAKFTDLQQQIDAIVVSSDVFDVVGTYADLQAYDITTVPVNDIIKVLEDSTRNNAMTYYRCTETGGVKSWTYIGSEGPFYTKAEADAKYSTIASTGASLDYTGTTLSLENSSGTVLSSVTIQSSPDLDGKSITKNTSNELQTIGVINQNDTTTAIKTWTGTKAQYEAIVTKNASTEYFCTDSGELYLGDVKIGSSGGLEIGDIGIAPLGIDELENKRRYLNGQVISQAQFVSFTDKLKSIVALYPNLATTEVNWQATVTNSDLGQCGQFVIDDVAGTIRLPKVVNINGLQNLALLGGIKAESLPNITGGFDKHFVIMEDSGTVNGSGAFSSSVSGTYGYHGWQQYTGLQADVKFDASDSSTTYQNNAPVQQEAVQYPYFIQVATGVETSVDVSREIELTNPFTLFQYQWSSFILNNASWLRADTFSWQSGAVYVSAYEQLLAEYNAGTSETAEGITYRLTSTGKKIALPDQETAIASLYTSTGKAWYYILDTENQRFKLPRELPFDGQAKGNEMTLGLTNGTNTNGLVTITNYGLCASNSYGNNIGTSANAGTISSNISVGVSTDPTKSGIILNRDNTDSQKYLYFYVGETVQDANIIAAASVLTDVADLKNAVANISFSPDYDNITSITSPYTATSDGVIYGWYSNADQSNRWLTINGNQLYSLTSGASYSNGYMPAGEYIVGEGDVITFGGDWGGMKFIPMKGAN